ncbi:transcriptional regulator with XRE-family HTH domain [Luteibacter sp. Sphag1AF]|nr:transcriptional regulator with XRE-family HTH domain [Luteibacter sp. Sphag1AF]
MSATIKLLDAYVKMCSHKNDSEAARALRVTPQTVNNWRKAKSHPDAESVERMCMAVNEPVAHWLPLIEAERARTPEARRVWLRLAQAAACITLIAGLTSAPYPAQARGAFFAENASSVYYVKS